MDRPTFQQVMKQVNYMSPQKGDLMDNLVRMLEKYSTNLEAIVAERTQELAAEKAKSEELVCRMLPRAIAEQLKRGEHVSAETFECVTIYFRYVRILLTVAVMDKCMDIPNIVILYELSAITTVGCGCFCV